MNKKLQILFLLAGILGFSFQGALYSQEPIKTITHHYPPYMSSFEKTGIGIEIFNSACMSEGISTEILFYPPKRARKVFEKNMDAIYLGLYSQFSEEEHHNLIFVPDLPLRMVFFYYKPNHPKGIGYKKLEDLQSYKIGTMHGSATTRSLKKAGIEAEESSLEGLFKKLKSNQVDLVTVLDLHGIQTIEELFPDKKQDFLQLKKPLMKLYGGIVLHRNNPKAEMIAEKYEKGIKKIKKNKLYFQILEKYYKKNNVPEYLYEDY